MKLDIKVSNNNHIFLLYKRIYKYHYNLYTPDDYSDFL